MTYTKEYRPLVIQRRPDPNYRPSFVERLLYAITRVGDRMIERTLGVKIPKR